MILLYIDWVKDIDELVDIHDADLTTGSEK